MRSLVLVAALGACSSSSHHVPLDGDTLDADNCPGKRSYTAADNNSNGEEFCVNFATGSYINCVAGTADNTTGNPRLIVVGAGFSPTDDLEIDLVRGFPPFLPDPTDPANNPPLPYTAISNLDLSTQGNFATCGACVIINVGINQTTGKPTAQYLANAGTFNLNEINGDGGVAMPAHATGSLTNVTLVHSIIDTSTNTSHPDPDGCTTEIPTLSFDTDLALSKPGHLRLRVTR